MTDETNVAFFNSTLNGIAIDNSRHDAGLTKVTRDQFVSHINGVSINTSKFLSSVVINSPFWNLTDKDITLMCKSFNDKITAGTFPQRSVLNGNVIPNWQANFRYGVDQKFQDDFDFKEVISKTNVTTSVCADLILQLWPGCKDCLLDLYTLRLMNFKWGIHYKSYMIPMIFDNRRTIIWPPDSELIDLSCGQISANTIKNHGVYNCPINIPKALINKVTIFLIKFKIDPVFGMASSDKAFFSELSSFKDFLKQYLDLAAKGNKPSDIMAALNNKTLINMIPASYNSVVSGSFDIITAIMKLVENRFTISLQHYIWGQISSDLELPTRYSRGQYSILINRIYAHHDDEGEKFIMKDGRILRTFMIGLVKRWRDDSNQVYDYG